MPSSKRCANWTAARAPARRQAKPPLLHLAGPGGLRRSPWKIFACRVTYRPSGAPLGKPSCIRTREPLAPDRTRPLCPPRADGWRPGHPGRRQMRSWDQVRSGLKAGDVRGRAQNALRSSGTSPNFRMTFASQKSPVARSPVRLKATAPITPVASTALRRASPPRWDRNTRLARRRLRPRPRCRPLR